MKDIFIQLLNMSIVASWLIVAVILFRFIFKKAPKWIVGMLWCMVGVRLVCPFSFHSRFSLVPSQNTIVVEGNSVVVDSGIRSVDDTINAYLQQEVHETETTIVSNSEKLLTSRVATILLYIWMVGVVVLVFGSAFSYLRLKYRLKEAIRLESNIFQTEKIDSPFVFGIFRPVIYIPYKLKGGQLECVIMHEQMHIRRKDYLIKPIGYILFAIYWFNPLIWIAYVMLCRDIELACDEKVIRTLGYDKIKIYSQTLLECSIPQSMLLACPVAFAEIGVKERIVNVMKLKKTKKGIVVGAFATVALVTIGFMTNPLAASDKSDDTTELEMVTTETYETEPTTAAAEETLTEEMPAEEPSTEETLTEEMSAEEPSTEEPSTEETSVEEPSTEEVLAEPEEFGGIGSPVANGCVVTKGFSDSHPAIDIAGPLGTPLFAALGGTVTAVGFDADNGNYFVITNAQGWSVYYNHCQDTMVSLGEVVNAGSIVGSIGNTGNSTGPHVHFALSNPDGVFVDPAQFGYVY